MSEQLLLDTRTLYIKNIEDLLVPHINKGFQTMYNQLSRIYKDKTLINFQLYLSRMPILTKDMYDDDFRFLLKSYEITEESISKIILNIYTCYHKLDNLLNGNSNDFNKIEGLPTPKEFVKKCYVNSARSLYEVPYLFHSKNRNVENLDKVSQIIRSNIEKSIREFLILQVAVKQPETTPINVPIPVHIPISAPVPMHVPIPASISVPVHSNHTPTPASIHVPFHTETSQLLTKEQQSVPVSGHKEHSSTYESSVKNIQDEKLRNTSSNKDINNMSTLLGIDTRFVDVLNQKFQNSEILSKDLIPENIQKLQDELNSKSNILDMINPVSVIIPSASVEQTEGHVETKANDNLDDITLTDPSSKLVNEPIPIPLPSNITLTDPSSKIINDATPIPIPIQNIDFDNITLTDPSSKIINDDTPIQNIDFDNITLTDPSSKIINDATPLSTINFDSATLTNPISKITDTMSLPLSVSASDSMPLKTQETQSAISRSKDVTKSVVVQKSVSSGLSKHKSKKQVKNTPVSVPMGEFESNPDTDTFANYKEYIKTLGIF